MSTTVKVSRHPLRSVLLVLNTHQNEVISGSQLPVLERREMFVPRVPSFMQFRSQFSCYMSWTLVEKWSLGKPEPAIRPGSHTNRDQCLALVPVRAARGPWSIGPGSVGGIRPGWWHQPGPKLSRRLWSRLVPPTGTNARDLVPVRGTNRDQSLPCLYT